ncbi:hypothetical protein L3Q82_008589, partial [Scortum barcoo]
VIATKPIKIVPLSKSSLEAGANHQRSAKHVRLALTMVLLIQFKTPPSPKGANKEQSYDGLEKKLKEVFSERSSILHQLSKTSKELDSIKGNLQSLKNDDSVAKKDVQRILELSHKQREEMKSLQAALQKQLDEANERAEKQQATIKFLKVEMEKKTKIIKDLQQEKATLSGLVDMLEPAANGHGRRRPSFEPVTFLQHVPCSFPNLVTSPDQSMSRWNGNLLFASRKHWWLISMDDMKRRESRGCCGKGVVRVLYPAGRIRNLANMALNKSLKTKLLSGHKLCDAYAEESKKIQAQLKELRYGKKDLIFKGQQLMDLEHKLTVAKEELEKTALDKESQLKALKDTVHICFSAVLHNQPSSSQRFPTSPTHLFRYSSLINSSRVTFQQPHAKDISKVQRIVTASKSPVNIGVMRRESGGVKECQMEKTGGNCFQNQTEESALESKKLPEPQQQRSQAQTGKFNTKLSDDSEEAEGGSSKKTKPHKYN